MNSRLRSFVLYVTAAAILIGLFSHLSTAIAKPAKESGDAMKEAHAKLVQLLDKTNDLFYKAQTGENGKPFYTIIWESGGKTSKMVLKLEELGHYDNEYVYALSAWSTVASSQNPVPPAVIKTIATQNDTLFVGNYSCSKDFKHVYANMSGIFDADNPGAIWMSCAYLHTNRLRLKEKIDQVLVGAGT